MTTQQPLDRFETELLAELRAVVGTTERQVTTGSPSRWRRPAISLGAVAAATAAVFLATSGVGPSSTPTASASEVLLSAARHAEATAAADGTYWHVHTLESWDEGKSHGKLDSRQWQRKDGASWYADNGGPVTRVDGASFVLCDKEVDFAALQALPSDPGALRDALEDAMMHNDDGPVPADYRESFVTGCTLDLLTMPVSPDVRGAAFRSLAALPGTDNLGSTTDRSGRVGTGLAFGDDDYHQRVVIDPESGELLQFDLSGLKGERLGTVLEAGWTDTIPR
jgi:hypothetical protein